VSRNNDKVRLPADLPLERDLIASCIARPEAIQSCGIVADDFAIDSHRIIWRALLELSDENQRIDLVAVRSKLIDSDSLDAVGGEEFLVGFRQIAPVKALPLDRLKEKTRLRALRAQAEAVAEAAAGNNPDLALAAAEALSTDGFEGPRRPKTLRDLGREWYESLGRDPNEGTVSPGIAPLKRIPGRIELGSMTLIGADTNVGKSTLAMEMLMSAMLEGERVGYLSMEDPEKIVTQRLMSSLGGVSPKVVRRFQPGGAYEAEIDRAMRLMHDLNDRFQVANCIGMNEREALEQMTLMAKAGAKLIVLDYIGVVGCSVKQQDRRNEIRWIATRFKARAVALNVALVIVSQFQRPKDGDSAKKPTKHSFRESGDLEAMAEYAIVMWRKAEDDFAPVYCELAKSKTGGLGYGWTMQRESRRLDGRPGSGRLIEVAHGDDDIRDEHGNRIEIREVIPDHGGERWSVQKSSR
jgi:replicative DNA helicase